MESWLQDIFGWLPEGKLYYLTLGLIAYAESIVGLGILVPGSVLTVFAGFLAAHGKGDILPLLEVCTVGSLLGDLTSYWLGSRLGMNLFRVRFLSRHQDLFRKAEIFFNAHGGKSVFLGRFVGPIRGFVPFVAGCTRMSVLPFFIYALVSAALWGLAYPGIGYLGGASWQHVRQMSGRVSLLVAGLVALFFLNAFFWRTLFPRLAHWFKGVQVRWLRQWRALQTRPSLQWIKREFPGTVSFLKARFTLARGSGFYLTAGVVLTALFGGGLALLIANLPILAQLDRKIHGALTNLHHPVADAGMQLLSGLGDWLSLALLGSLLLLWLILHNRDFSALLLIVGMAGARSIEWLLARLPSPGQVHFDSGLGDLPLAGGPAFHILVFFGLAVYLLLNWAENWEVRTWLIMGGSFLALLVGTSRIYLEMTRFSDLLTALLLASLWLTFLVTASEIRRRYAGEFPWRSGWEPLKLTARGRAAIMIPAGLAVLIAVGIHLWQRLPPG